MNKQLTGEFTITLLRIWLTVIFIVAVYSFLVSLGLHCWARAFFRFGEHNLISWCGVRVSHRCGFSRGCGAQGPGARVSNRSGFSRGCGAQGPGVRVSGAVVHGLHSLACGIFPDQGQNPRPPHCLALDHQGSGGHLNMFNGLKAQAWWITRGNL